MTSEQTTWLRRLGMGTALALPVLLAVNLAFVLYGRSQVGGLVAQLEQHVGSLDELSLDKPPVADSENAAAFLTDGAGLIVLPEAGKELFAAAQNKAFQTWGQEEIDGMRALLAKNAAALELLHTAASLEKSNYEIPYGKFPPVRADLLLPLIRATRLLMVEARLALVDGDHDKALAALRSASKLVSTLAKEPLLITALIQTATERMVLYVAAEAAVGQPSRRPAEGFYEQLDALLPSDDPITVFQKGVLVDAVLSNLFWKQAAASGLETKPREVTGRVLAALHEDLEAAEDLKLHTEIIALARTPYGSAPERFTTSAFEGEDEQGALPNMLSAIYRFQITAGQKQLVRAALRLRQTAARTGRYPAAAPDRIRELFAPDPFSGKPITYALQRDGSLELTRTGVDALVEGIEASAFLKGLTSITLPPLP